MRALLALPLVVLALAGCATPLPAKDDFGASGLLAVGDIPPGFVEFNSFDAATNGFDCRSALRDAAPAA